MADEYSDILGAGTLPIGPKNTGFWSSLSLTSKSSLILVLLLASYVGVSRLWGAFWKWREREYKLSMRRKYGIPDNDHRPFNVAYAAAQLAREQEIQQRGKKRSAVQPPTQVSSREQRDGFSDSIRHRPTPQHNSSSAKFPGSLSEDRSHLIPGGNSSHLNGYSDHHHPYNNRVTFADGYNTSASPLDVHAELAPLSSSTRRVSDRKNLGILKSSNHNYPRVKRALVEDDLEERFDSKKTRVEGEELTDGDEDAEWQSHGHGRAPSQYVRVSKRGFEEGDVEERDKRQRKVSAERMEVDDDIDVVGELVSVSPSRGRKRDRTEAGSTFGGDDDDENIALEEDYGNRSRYRKRRNKRTSDAHSGHSRKRDRDLNDTGDYSDSNEDPAGAKSSRSKKKGKKQQQQRSEDEKGSDVSMDDSQFVRSTLKGRKIGEEWTSNGVKYKISPNGQRLRETLLKKAKQRFVMPEDSVHPDRNAFHDVYVEAWLTDEEHQNFATQGAIYEPPKEPDTPSSNNSPLQFLTVSKRSTPPMSKGKHLLWESTIAHPLTPLANPFESRKAADGASNALVPRSLGLQVAFPKSGRIASAFRGSVNADSTSGPPSPSLVDSTNSLSSPRAGKYRQYSKWEKQDMEAQAMIRMREANNKKKEEDRIAREKKEQEARTKAATTPTPTVPTISFTKPPEDQVKEAARKSQTSSPFSLGTTTSVSGTPVPPSAAPKLTPTSAGSNTSSSVPDNKPKAPSPLSFSFAPTSLNVTSPSTGAASATPSGFSFAQPPSALSGKPQEATSAGAKPATPSGFFAQPLSSKSQEGPKSLGLGFPSSTTSSQNQPASITFPPPTSAPIPTNATSAPTTAHKFNFGLPVKPAAEPPKEITPNVGSTNPLLARLSPVGDSNAKPQATPSQGTQAAADPSTSTTPYFSFTKPATSSAVSSSSSSPPVTLGQKPTDSQTQQATPSSSSSGAPTPLKFSFGAFKTPAPSTTSTPATATTIPGHDSYAGFSESKPATQNVFALSTPQGSSNTFSTTGPPKFNFGAAASSTSGTAMTNISAKSPFGVGNTLSTGATAGSPSPFGSVFGTPATPAAETKDQPRSSSAFGTGATGSLFGNNGTPSAFGSGSSGVSGAFGSVSSSNPLGSKAETTLTSKPDIVASPSAFGSAGFGAFGSASQDSASGAAAPKPGFVGFGTASTSVANGPSSISAPATSLFGSGGTFGSSSAPGSNASGSSKPAEGSKFSFETPGASAPADRSDVRPTTLSFGGSTTPAGTPAAMTKSPFLFGAPSGTSGSGTSNGGFSFANGTTSTTPASSPFGGASGSTTAFGAFGANSSTMNTTPNSFNFGATPSTSQQPK
ncbi:hypothetical protein L218DRAFT_985909 [Marasmius fiardii PR-910]|nr:hypothetical protein L218DRAFT_985909 [Marasmius fiardii PR-910]